MELMANFKITATTTVAELKEQFHNEFGGILRVYQGRSEAPEDATLVSLGGKVGELECRASRTVGKFIEAFQSELGLKVKVYTKDNWVSVLDGITLATVREIPKNARKAQMKQFLAYQRNEEEEVTEEAKADEEIYLRGKMGDNGKYGYVDENGIFVIEPKFDRVYFSFDEGLASVYINNKCGFIDKNGNFVIEPKFDDACNFSEGLAMAWINDKCGFIDKNGKFVIEPKFDEIRDFSEELANVKIDEKWGYIDKSGKFVIEPKFDYACDFDKGIASVSVDDCDFNIDTKGNVIDDIDCATAISNSDEEDSQESKIEDIKSRGDIIVVMFRSNAKNVEELYQEVGNGDSVSVISLVDDEFHYIGDESSSIEELGEKDIDFDNLYLIYDDNGELDELNLNGRVYSGSYLSEDEWSHYQSDNYPSDDNALCYVMTEALTGDDTGHVNGVYFDAPKVFICDGKIIAECD